MLKTNNTSVLATSVSEKNQAEHTIGYSPLKVMVLNNATPPFDLSTIKAYPVIHSNYICTVARPSYQKNIEMLLDVFLLITNKQNDIHLFIIGAGEYSPDLNKIKKRYQFSHIRELIKSFEKSGTNPIMLKAAWERNLLARNEKDWETSKSAVS